MLILDTMDMEMFAKLFGSDIMTIHNPVYPLKFERFGTADSEKDPEFRSHVQSLKCAGNPVSSEMGAVPSYYCSKRIFKAEEKARMAYSSEDPVKIAKEALSISPYCPEAYNVMAVCGSDTYEEALGTFNLCFLGVCGKVILIKWGL